MKEIFGQLVKIWRAFKPFQKLTVISILLFVVGALGYFTFCSSSSRYVSLFPIERLSRSDLAEIREFLQQAHLSFQEKKEGGIHVLEEHAGRIRMELAALGIPKEEQGKGFELFDTNTWIKGEKELQVLEMRALKGQLERDIAEYENIKSASVILDLAPPRPFGGTPYKTKASVILTLMPGAHLNISELRAITYHLAGAVRGLEPQMIAISDTTGRLYKAINPEEEGDSFAHEEWFLEEHIRAKIDSMLAKVVGADHFYSTVQLTKKQEVERIEAISVGVLIDRGSVGEEREELRGEIQRQLRTIVAGYGVQTEPAVDFVPFEKKKGSWTEKKEKMSVAGLFFTCTTFILILLALIPLFRRYNRNKKQPKLETEDPDEALFQLMTRIDLHKLADSIKEEDPSTIALMLSYLHEHRAEKILKLLPDSVRKEVLAHLIDMESEDVS